MEISLANTLFGCKQKSIQAKSNIFSGGPESWFTTENLNQLGVRSVSFDFFVNWSNKKFVRTIWLKRTIDISVNELTKELGWEQKVVHHLTQFEGKEQLEQLKKLGGHLKINIDFLLFNEKHWSPSENIIYARLCNNNIAIKSITLDELKHKINIGTGMQFNIGRKGLTYSTSQLECHLSTTSTPYPGDADTILFDRDFESFKIIEFKKHNLTTPISEQMLFNYYPNPDRVKYNRLEILRRHIPNANLYTLYYTTDNRFETKIELNAYGNNNLTQGESILIPSPRDKHDKFEVMSYLKKCLQFIDLAQP